jgi:hypothetical protein
MQPERQTDNSTRVVVIVVASVFGGGLLVALACGGVFYFTTYTLFRTAEKSVNRFGERVEQMTAHVEAESVAQTFLTEVAGNQLDRAYAQTTHAYQGRLTAAEFRAEVEKHPSLKKHRVAQLAVPTPAAVNDRVTVHLMLDGDRANLITLDMLKEDGRWKVDDFSAP